MSSRNIYLSAEQRMNATVLYRALQDLRSRIDAGERNAAALIARVREQIEAAPGTRIDYVAVVDADRLEPVERLQGKILAAMAVYFGATRLIDNILLNVV
jgi:pantoate--beta-alanine ligase